MVTLRCECGESWEATRVAHIKDQYWTHVRECAAHVGGFFMQENNLGE